MVVDHIGADVGTVGTHPPWPLHVVLEEQITACYSHTDTHKEINMMRLVGVRDERKGLRERRVENK